MKRRTGERGQVLPLVALCLAVLVGFAGIAVDVGYLEYQQRQQQSATDAAAIGGAQQFLYSGCGTSTGYTAATTDAATNGYSNSTPNVTVSPGPPPSGPYAGNNCAVQVTITSPHATFFTRAFGYANMPETTQAIATIEGNPACVIMLQPGQNTNFNNATVTAPNCNIQLNGPGNFSSSTVAAAGILEADYAGSNNDGTFTEASPISALPAADPCPEIAGCAYLTNNPPATSPCNTPITNPMQPGCYDSLNLHGATVTLNPGVYVLPGGSNFGMATISGTGVTLYIPAGATTNFDKATLSLSPPLTGNTAGVTIYQVSSNTTPLNLNKGTTNLQGLIYAPNAQVNYNGSLGQYVLLVAAYGNLNGSSTVDFGTPGSGLPYLLHQAVLVQ